jgi:hypothetical protein
VVRPAVVVPGESPMSPFTWCKATTVNCVSCVFPNNGNNVCAKHVRHSPTFFLQHYPHRFFSSTNRCTGPCSLRSSQGSCRTRFSPSNPKKIAANLLNVLSSPFIQTIRPLPRRYAESLIVTLFPFKFALENVKLPEQPQAGHLKVQ